MMVIGLIFVFVGIILLVFSFMITPVNHNYPKEKRTKDRLCILIPARDESKVIESLLISIEKQTEKINAKDVYVIVESEEDPTVGIVNSHNMNVVYRRDLSKRRKGYALDDAIRYIVQNKKKYDAYFIIDADNILDKDFIKEMKRDIDQGYDIGIGYRNNKNGDSLVSCASLLTFSLINTLMNERKCKYSNTVTISGTGYYISGEIIEKWGGFPFISLTEDYELTLYATLNNLTTSYNTKAIFYDEQPDNFNVSIMQRTRWVKGFFEARKKYIKKIRINVNIHDINFASKINAIIGVNHLICVIIGIILILVNILIKYNFKDFVLSLIMILSAIYFILVILTYTIIKKDTGMMNINVSKTKLIFYNPIFLAGFVVCLLRAIGSRDLEWNVIAHDKNFVCDVNTKSD